MNRMTFEDGQVRCEVCGWSMEVVLPLTPRPGFSVRSFTGPRIHAKDALGADVDHAC
jgi:hypothetical protein